MHTLDSPDFDVIVIGAGPAGSSMAAYLAKAGVKCAVFEREIFPRPHVGESLVPSSTRIFKELDFLRVMEEARFPRKYGAVWTAVKAPQQALEYKDIPGRAPRLPEYGHDWEGMEADVRADIRFEERDQPGVDQNYTYHVDRGLFDNLLLHHAQGLGASVYEGMRVRGAEVTSDGVTVWVMIGDREVPVTCRIVVDASGRNTLLGNQQKWRIRDDVFDQYAIHTWFEGYDRNTVAYKHDLDNYIFVHFLPITNSWIWQIPITEDITSIGVVTQKKHFAKNRESREKFFWECVATRPELHDALQRAKRVRPFKDEGDYSYAMRRLTDDRIVLVGDAARFVDPIFSTGVSIALNSSRFASRDILGALETGNFGREAFSNYETTIRRGTKNWYNFISVYYRLNVLFTAFINDPRYRLDVLQLLQGDVYGEQEPEVLTKMREMVTTVEQNENHVWHKLLGDLTANAFVTASQTAV